MKHRSRLCLIASLAITLTATIIAVCCIIAGLPYASKWLATSGLLATVSGVIQIDVSELFQRLIQEYTNDQKYPNGPPSYVAREIVDNPDRPLGMMVRDVTFFDPRTGLWLIICGSIVQAIAVWL